jgi:periplasmic protein TonB
MRSASFFLLSVSLHVAALAYPVTFAQRDHGKAIPVNILPEERHSGGGGDSGESGNSEPKDKSNSHFAARPATAPSVEAKPVNSTRAPQIVAATEGETVSESGVAFSATPAPPHSDVNAALVSTSRITLGGGSGAGGAGLDGNGFGAGSGTGNGNGMGSGPGESGSGVAMTQARYRETPRPEYPDSARRDGREGRVLLRVLVDDQGHSKQVEINSSSGSDALDRAAAEAIKRWRFHPARYGDKPVESWLRIPIEFRLADAKSR